MAASIEAQLTSNNPNHPQTLNKESLTHLLDTKCHHSLHLLKQTHAMLIKLSHFQDNYISGSLIKHYSNPNLNSFTTALKVFDHVPQPHVFLWNSLIRACIDNNHPYQAILAYHHMMLQGSIPNNYTFPLVLNACNAAEAIEEGKQFHAHFIKQGLGGDKYIKSAAIQMYGACRMMVEAKRMLTSCSDSACWNAMIDGYVKNGDLIAAKELFDVMPCRNIRSWNAMISGYARNGKVDEAKKLFDDMPQRDGVSWSAIINGYVQCGCFTDALEMFRWMLKEGVAIDKFVLSSALTACANVCALEQGRWIHAYIDRNFKQLDPVLGASLVDMYAKCGHLDLASEVFKKIQQHKQVFSWNAMISGFAIHGQAEQALELFALMQKENVKPNAITFIVVLNACAHTGLVDEGYKHINSMEKDFGITPRTEHYGCMVDLLGRAGLLEEAESMINSMPMKPNAAVWGALLGACRIHGNAELGERVAKLLLELEPENSGRYAVLSNIYAKAIDGTTLQN
ncbi:putative tetratricopeptide-like helical domain superfamily [Dioscorea sansibarensis]